jgi:hypothetical protein
VSVAVSVLGCSTHWREADVSEEQLQAALDDISAGTSNVGGGDTSQVLALKDDAAAIVYYAEAPGSMGSVANLIGITDFSFLNSGLDIWYGNITAARVIFIDLPTASGRQDGLILGLATSSSAQTTAASGFTYYSFTGNGSIGGGEFSAQMQGGGTVIIRTTDVSDGDLDGVIQLRFYAADQSGNEVYIGKISTLAGFGN